MSCERRRGGEKERGKREGKGAGKSEKGKRGGKVRKGERENDEARRSSKAERWRE